MPERVDFYVNSFWHRIVILVISEGIAYLTPKSIICVEIPYFQRKLTKTSMIIGREKERDNHRRPVRIEKQQLLDCKPYT